MRAHPSQAMHERRPRRAGYLPLRDYAAIGDGRTAALVGGDGSIDWLCLPDLDSPSVLAAILDAGHGGRFELAPETSFEAKRRYVPDTNVLETTFSTSAGTVRVTDGMTVSATGLAPGREIVRRIEALSGRTPMRWCLEPRFGYGAARTRIERRGAVAVATSGADALALCSWDAGEPQCEDDRIHGAFEIEAGAVAVLSISAAQQEPLVLPARDQVERRLDETVAFWKAWLSMRSYQGPWREAVMRSALTLKLLVFAPSGAIAAAPTSSLPESIGGERNWDYRFSWVRDSAFTLSALIEIGCRDEAEAFFWWLMHASHLTHPELHVLYGLAGHVAGQERALSLDGYRGSRPVRVGNAAATQRQLDVYGELFQTASMYARVTGRLDGDFGRRLARTADLVCRIWREPDSGIWEVRSEPVHFTQSKMSCWVALSRACELAEQGHIPAAHVDRWGREAAAVQRFIETRCWSDELDSYARFAGAKELDASLLLGVLMGYGQGCEPRLKQTVEAVRRHLGSGPLLYRYTGEDGLEGDEGFFLCCSFWLVEALSRCGRPDDAAEMMEQLLALANDVGLYAEEIDAATGEFLGNFPQALVHLALISAAVAMEKEQLR
jgi:GH15 family glucan-1,4-alpha-glucosidase